MEQAHDVFSLFRSIFSDRIRAQKSLGFVWRWLVAYYSIPGILSSDKIMPFDSNARIKNQNQLICRTTGVHDFSQTYTLDTEDVYQN